MRLFVMVMFLSITQLHAATMDLSCTTTREVESLYTKDFKVIRQDENILSKETYLKITDSGVVANFWMFEAVECDTMTLDFSESKIEAYCHGAYLGSEYDPKLSKSLRIDRYTGVVAANVKKENEDGTTYFYFYEGKCSKLKKLF